MIALAFGDCCSNVRESRDAREFCDGVDGSVEVCDDGQNM